MHSIEYHRYKADIMGPIDEFFILLDQRTAQAVTDAENSAAFLHAVLLGSLTLMALAVVFATWVLLGKVVPPLVGLKEAMVRLPARSGVKGIAGRAVSEVGTVSARSEETSSHAATVEEQGSATSNPAFAAVFFPFLFHNPVLD
ncbi:MAG TPA: hypothetical protein VEB64_11665 [Azospirillaceae bacterium]|nr:hypothetical protein [Azospirillaceae bacterium]